MKKDAAINTEIEQFLTFEISGEAYGIEILKVQEIRGWEPVRPIPNTPEYIKGALNLRGAIVPIVDLRERFRMGKAEYSNTTVVIVINIDGSSGGNIVGIVADAVSDVLDIKIREIKQAPKLGANIDTRYMRGMYVADKRMVLLLDVNKLLNQEELNGVAELL